MFQPITLIVMKSKRLGVGGFKQWRRSSWKLKSEMQRLVAPSLSLKGHCCELHGKFVWLRSSKRQYKKSLRIMVHWKV